MAHGSDVARHGRSRASASYQRESASTFTDPATPFGQEMKAKGLQTRHAYGLLECRVYDGEHLFKLRNPNGVALWKGKWSREDAERMTFAARKALGLDREDPGVFWMAVDDFLAYFVELTVCRVLRDRVDARHGREPPARGDAVRPVAADVVARRRRQRVDERYPEVDQFVAVRVDDPVPEAHLLLL